ncbi:MAG TPA: cysteine desulfuration protein SufE [Myxococcales bacterium]|nr:cysteine desulfuration protein SufE [Deltaproteobacteria bacterium]MBU52590.1 cysteine desulfuration protein SufE [Deltaproteobacteria bacterium]HAA56377.1 cysteine desulfuration protein SufE [Myxococcales bacterium]|tara:strand:+ start:12487 stop:12903 length:417 start_codon:yes stop_codon:yes gene_type:complete
MTLDELVDNFEFLGDWEERYRYIIDLGKKLPPMPEEAKTEENLVQGCISKVWMTANVHDDQEPTRIEFIADSDAFIVKGLIGIALMLYSDKTPEEILALDISNLFERLGLDEHLTVNRRNGFQSMLNRIKSIAKEAQA